MVKNKDYCLIGGKMDYIKIPMDIEKRSFEIIGEEMGPHNFNERELSIIKRVIHTTADFEYKDLV